MQFSDGISGNVSPLHEHQNRFSVERTNINESSIDRLVNFAFKNTQFKTISQEIVILESNDDKEYSNLAQILTKKLAELNNTDFNRVDKSILKDLYLQKKLPSGEHAIIDIYELLKNPSSSPDFPNSFMENSQIGMRTNSGIRFLRQNDELNQAFLPLLKLYIVYLFKIAQLNKSESKENKKIIEDQIVYSQSYKPVIEKTKPKIVDIIWWDGKLKTRIPSVLKELQIRFHQENLKDEKEHDIEEKKHENFKIVIFKQTQQQIIAQTEDKKLEIKKDIEGA
jgi:hypothetical protein